MRLEPMIRTNRRFDSQEGQHNDSKEMIRVGTQSQIWEHHGNNNLFQGRLQGFLERPGPCKYRG